MTATKQKADAQAEAVRELRKILKPGDTVYSVLRRVSKSGMARWIDFYVIGRDRVPRWITGRIGLAIGSPQSLADWKASRGLRVNGCGMDMGFHVVHELGYALWPKGFKLPKGRPGRNGDTSGYESHGGYALRHAWL